MSANRIRLDTETKSRRDLKQVGVYAYVECPDFRILILTYSIDGGPAQVTTDPDEITRLLVEWTAARHMLVAHNASFDRVVCSEHLRRAGHLGQYEYLDPSRWDCTAVLSAEVGRPRPLSEVAKALDCTPKDSAGKALIRLFTRPNRKGDFNDETTHPDEWADFIRYALQDTDTLVEVDQQLPGWPSATERRAWVLDQRINDRGIRVDVPLAQAAEAAASYNRMCDELEVMAATGIRNPGSVQQMLKWLDGVVPNLQAATVEEALAGENLTDLERKVLELRQELALSSASKFTAALSCMSPDERVRGMFTFYGATTGRWSSRGPQFQNMPRLAFKTDAEVDAAMLDLALGLGGSPATLKKLIRPMYVGPFTALDFSSIEARVIAWLADETWALEAFRDGQDIYVATAEKMGGMTRQQGKTAVLALGFGGGADALRRMAGDRAAQCSVAGVDVWASDEELDAGLEAVKVAWREANPRIVRLWRRLAANVAEGGPCGSRLAIRRVGPSMRLVLPSGRALQYHGMVRSRYKVPAPTEEDPDRMVTKTGWRYTDPSRPALKTGMWYGSLVENAVQALARDVLVASMLRLDEEGYTILGSVHDEVIIDGEHDPEVIAKIMCEVPSWATGLPLNAEGWSAYRYRK